MGNDRYDSRGERPRDDRSRWSSDRNERSERDWNRDRDGDRGFFERAGDEIASWFGDDDSERRRGQDRPSDERDGRHARGPVGASRQSRDDDRGFPASRNREVDRDRGSYRPITGDYGRSEGSFGRDDDRFERGPRGGFWSRDEERRPARAASAPERGRSEDPHYSSWRQRQLDDLDRDYDEYRRENQSRFESDFGNWRQTRQQKRTMLGQIREHMAVVGTDDEHVGTVDKIAGDRIILAKSDPDSGGVHHSLSCASIDRVEGDKVILDCTAEKAKQNWRDDSRERALFEREDQGQAGPHILDRSFGGTYR